jgi:glycosyltransferase involved in cell wall biosynthesis
VVVPNGIDPGLFRYNENHEKDARLVLCVARIEGIKNQLNLYMVKVRGQRVLPRMGKEK